VSIELTPFGESLRVATISPAACPMRIVPPVRVLRKAVGPKMRILLGKALAFGERAE
jgi:hypothetical protein